MEPKSIIDQFLDKYPKFFTQAETSNHYKWVDTLAGIFKDLDTQKVKVELGKDPNRPFQLWRVQTTDFSYVMKLRVKLPDIKQVDLFKAYTDFTTVNSTMTEEDNVLTVTTNGTDYSGVYNTDLIDIGDNTELNKVIRIKAPKGIDIQVTTYNSTWGVVNTAQYTGTGNFEVIEQLQEVLATDTFYIFINLIGAGGPTEFQIKNGVSVEVGSSGQLLEGTNIFESEYYDRDTTIVPTKKYYLHITDYHGHDFYKGFPENETILNDIYDRDLFLDIIGKINQIPRRKLLTDIADEDLPQTSPPYCNDPLEWDYTYQQRIKEHLYEYQHYNLSLVEFKRLFDIFPIIEGRWRYLCRMDEDLMDSKFMATDEWHPCVFDIHATLENIPKNISQPSPDDIQSLLERTFPLSKRAYFTLIIATPAGTDNAVVYDKVDMAVEMGRDAAVVAENYVANVSTPIEEDIIGLADNLRFIPLPVSKEVIGWVESLKLITTRNYDIMGLVERLEAIETAEGFVRDSDFSPDTLTNVEIHGTGSAQYVDLAAVSTYDADYPSGQSQDAQGLAWINPQEALNTGNTYAYSEDNQLATVTNDPGSATTEGSGIAWYDPSAAADHSMSYYAESYADPGTWTRYLVLSGLGFSIGDMWHITGLRLRVYGKGSGHTIEASLRNYNETSDTRTDTMPGSDGWMYFGGNGDTWGFTVGGNGTIEHPAYFNGNNLDIKLRVLSNGAHCDIRYMELDIYCSTDLHQSSVITLTGLSFDVPSGSTVVGVRTRVLNYCTEAGKTMDVTITAGGVSKTKTMTQADGAAAFVYLGSSTDKWGGLPSTPSSYSSITAKLQSNTAFHSRIYDVYIQVYYLLQDGTLVSETITAPPSGYGWERIIIGEDKPSQCGANALLYDVLRASDNAVLKSNQSHPIDISDLAYTNLKLKAKFHTDNVAYVPSIDYYVVYYNKIKAM